MTDLMTLPDDVESVSLEIERVLARFDRRVELRAMEGRKITQAHVDRLATLRDRATSLLEATRLHRYPSQEEFRAVAERWAT